MPQAAAADNNNKDMNQDTMLAFSIVKAGDTTGQVVRIPKPQLEGPGFCLIRVLRAGVCNTDLEILQGYMGFTGVLGHEFVGIVERVYDKEADGHWIGKRVCGDINVGCASCDVCHDTAHYNTTQQCPQMARNHCPNRTVLGILQRNGTMAQYLTLPVRNLHRVPENMSDAVAVFAEPLAAACRITEQGLIRYNNNTDDHHGKELGSNTRQAADKVAILGDGKLGLMIAEVLGRAHLQRNKHSDTNNQPPILFGKHQHKLDLVHESGVVGKLVSQCQDQAATNGVAKAYAGKFDVVVDATGNPAGLSLAAGLVRPMGTLVLKSTCAAGEQFNAAPFVIDELRVVGSRCGPIDQALALLALDDEKSGVASLRVEKYITKAFSLAQADQAIQCAAEKSTMKIQIICNES